MTAARANIPGDLCPPWCVTDHGKYSFHGSERVAVEAPQFHRNTVRVTRIPGVPDDVAVNSLYVQAAAAEDLALLLERLADAAPADVRQLAAAIRQAAALVTEAGQ